MHGEPDQRGSLELVHFNSELLLQPWSSHFMIKRLHRFVQSQISLLLLTAKVSYGLGVMLGMEQCLQLKVKSTVITLLNLPSLQLTSISLNNVLLERIM